MAFILGAETESTVSERRMRKRSLRTALGAMLDIRLGGNDQFRVDKYSRVHLAYDTYPVLHEMMIHLETSLAAMQAPPIVALSQKTGLVVKINQAQPGIIVSGPLHVTIPFLRCMDDDHVWTPVACAAVPHVDDVVPASPEEATRDMVETLLAKTTALEARVASLADALMAFVDTHDDERTKQQEIKALHERIERLERAPSREPPRFSPEIGL